LVLSHPHRYPDAITQLLSEWTASSVGTGGGVGSSIGGGFDNEIYDQLPLNWQSDLPKAGSNGRGLDEPLGLPHSGHPRADVTARSLFTNQTEVGRFVGSTTVPTSGTGRLGPGVDDPTNALPSNHTSSTDPFSMATKQQQTAVARGRGGHSSAGGDRPQSWSSAPESTHGRGDIAVSSRPISEFDEYGPSSDSDLSSDGGGETQHFANLKKAWQIREDVVDVVRAPAE
jgi:hypothetical protein